MKKREEIIKNTQNRIHNLLEERVKENGKFGGLAFKEDIIPIIYDMILKVTGENKPCIICHKYDCNSTHDPNR